MGVNLLKWSFIVAVAIKISLSNSTLESKHNAYKHWGLFDEEIFSTFARSPRFVAHSKNKIMATMDFLVNKMGWESSYIIRNPTLLDLSLKKRIIPRCSVIKVLWSKGLINKKISLGEVFLSSE